MTVTQITEATRQNLLNERSLRRCEGRATLQAVGDRFVMTGPSGTHSLRVVATDAERLNAHWQGFCADDRNAHDPSL